MKNYISSSIVILGLAMCGLSACSQAEVKTSPAEVKAAADTIVKKTPGFEYVSMEGPYTKLKMESSPIRKNKAIPLIKLLKLPRSRRTSIMTERLIWYEPMYKDSPKYK